MQLGILALSEREMSKCGYAVMSLVRCEPRLSWSQNHDGRQKPSLASYSASDFTFPSLLYAHAPSYTESTNLANSLTECKSVPD